MSCTKRSCAYAFLVFGIVFVVIGVICGVVIPKMVANIIEDKACVDSADDPDYADWVKPSSHTIYKLYYWVIKNEEGILYHGETPKTPRFHHDIVQPSLTKIGRVISRLDLYGDMELLEEKGPYVYKVTSEKVGVVFNNSRLSYYDMKKKAVFTKEMSCSGCTENDKLTVLNMGYVGMMTNFGGDMAFSLLSLSNTIGTLLKQFNYTQLGNINASTWSDTHGSGWKNPEFGSWLRENYPILATTNFTEIEMRGLYDVLGNISTLFGIQLTGDAAKQRCKENPTGFDCGFIAHITANALSVRGYISDALCKNATHSCFNTTTRANIVPVIFSYMLHVGRYTIWLLLHEQDDIITTLTQTQLALGYKMKHVRLPTGQLVEVPGLIMLPANEAEAKKKDQMTFYTCDAEKEKHHQWAAFNGQSTIPSHVFNLTNEERIISGYNKIVPHSESTGKPCSFSRKLPMDSFDVFFYPIYLKFTLTYKEDTWLHGLALKRFVLSKENFLANRAVQHGLTDQANARAGVPLVASFPHFLYSDKSDIPGLFQQKPDEKKHRIEYDVDPVTGGTFRASVRSQVNMQIRSSYISQPRIKPLNVAYAANATTDFSYRLIPVVWLDIGGEATASDIDTIKRKVIGLLSLSCGFLIALPVIGGIFVICFSALFATSVKANRVTEMDK